MTFHLGSAIR